MTTLFKNMHLNYGVNFELNDYKIYTSLISFKNNFKVANIL